MVVSNADVANFYKKAVPSAQRKKWTDRRLERMRYSMSLFLIYFGTDRTYPELAHHTIVLTERYKELLEDIFQKKILADDFSLYLHAPTRTDPTLAPPGCECFYVLSPVPNLDGEVDWNAVKDLYANAILESLEKLCPDLRQHIISKLVWTPLDFESQLDAHLGSAFQFEPILTQSAWFRPHNVQRGREEFLPRRGGHSPPAPACPASSAARSCWNACCPMPPPFKAAVDAIAAATARRSAKIPATNETVSCSPSPRRFP